MCQDHPEREFCLLGTKPPILNNGKTPLSGHETVNYIPSEHWQPWLMTKTITEVKRKKKRNQNKMFQVYFFTTCFLRGEEGKGDSSWQFVLKLTSSQLRTPCCQRAARFLLRVWFCFLSFLSFFSLITEAWNQRNLVYASVSSLQICGITHCSQMPCFPPSNFHSVLHSCAQLLIVRSLSVVLPSDSRILY